jgi:hypothetical protein
MQSSASEIADLDEATRQLNATLNKAHENKIIAMDELQKILVKKSLIDGVISGIKIQKTSHAKKGAIAKKAKYQPLKDLAKQLVNSRNYKSRRNAAKTIAPEIITESKKLGIDLSPDQAEITITNWLKEMGLPANV